MLILQDFLLSTLSIPCQIYTFDHHGNTSVLLKKLAVLSPTLGEKDGRDSAVISGPSAGQAYDRAMVNKTMLYSFHHKSRESLNKNSSATNVVISIVKSEVLPLFLVFLCLMDDRVSSSLMRGGQAAECRTSSIHAHSTEAKVGCW